MNFNKIKTQRLMILIVFVACFILSGIYYYMSKKVLEDTAITLMQEISKQASINIEKNIQSRFEVLEAVASIPNIKDEKLPWEEKISILEQEISSHNHIVMGIADIDGSTKYTDGLSNSINDRDYFKKALEGNNAVSEPFVSNIDKKSLFVAYAVPIKEGNKVKAVLIALREGNDLGDMCKEIKFKQTGQAYMINKTGTVIAHKNRDLVLRRENVQEDVKQDGSLKDLAFIEKEMMNGNEGVGRYTYKNIEKYIAYTPIKTPGWSVGIIVEKHDLLNKIYNLRRNILIAFGMFIIIVPLILWKVSLKISKVESFFEHEDQNYEVGNIELNTNEAKNKSSSLAVMMGNLKVEKSSTQSSEELEKILNVLNDFGVKLDNVISSVDKLTSNMKNNSNE